MNLDSLPQQFEEFVERARLALVREITGAKNVVAAANAEKSSAQNSLTNLQSQIKVAQSQLDAVLSDLHRGSTLVGINTEIAAARKTLEALEGEKEEKTKGLEKLSKERADLQAQVNALGNEAQRLIAIRTEAEGVMAGIKQKLAGVQLGQRQ
jgi:chromosome segregation ATPase